MKPEKIFAPVTQILLILLVVLLEFAVRWLAGAKLLPDLATTLSSLGLGLVLPFPAFESLLVGKIFGIRSEYKVVAGRVTVSYVLEPTVAAEKIPRLRFWTFVVVVCCSVIWIVTLVLSLKTMSHDVAPGVPLAFGILNCLVSWVYLVFV